MQMFVIFLRFCISMSHFLFDLCLPLIINEFDHMGLCPKEDPDIYFKFDLLCVFEMSVTPVSFTLFLPHNEVCSLLIKHWYLVKCSASADTESHLFGSVSLRV